MDARRLRSTERGPASRRPTMRFMLLVKASKESEAGVPPTKELMAAMGAFNEQMAKALAAKGYRYQFVFVRDAGHCDRNVKQQTLPLALEYVWKTYPIEGKLAH